MTLNYFSLAGFLTGVASILLGTVVLIKGSPRKLAVTWFGFSIPIMVWGFSATWIGIIREPHQALFAWRMAYALGVIWSPVLFFHFVTRYTGFERNRSLLLHYVCGSIFVFLATTDKFFSGVRWTFDSFYHPVLGSLFVPFLVVWIASIVWSHVLILKKYRESDLRQRNQIRYFFLAMAIAYGGSSVGYLPKFGIDVYPWGDFAIPLYPLIMSYAILRYRLMDIRIFVRRAILFLSVYALLLAICAAGVYFLHMGRLTAAASMSELVVEIVFFGAILSLGPFLYAYAIRESSYFRENEMAGIAHELKSPLGTIQSAIESLGALKKGLRVSEKHEDYIEMIGRNADRLGGAIDNLLAVFKIAATADSLQREKLDVNGLVEKVRSRYGDMAGENGVSISVENHGSSSVCADYEKINQVISNLLSNAIKYSPGGEIVIRIDDLARSVKVTIADNGKGIPADEIDYVFDRFFQGKNSKNVKGSGMGLAIAKSWIEIHGGEIGVKSDGEGKGSCFWFTLPKQ